MSRSSSARALALAASAAPAPSDNRIRVPLRDLGLAPENLRFDEAADERIAQLADTIAAAGVIVPPIVRTGRKNEQAYMTLDGRRRRLALLELVARGAIDEDYAVECVLAVGKAAQAAAIVLPNAETAPVHIASIIMAIGSLRKAKMDTAFIAASLGYSELEIKRLEALAGVHPTVLAALRQGRLTLKQVRAFTRIADKTQQEQLAQAALDGHFQEYQLRKVLDEDELTARDPRFALVGAGRYSAAGGRLVADLFGELPDKVLDADILDAQWRVRIMPLIEAYKAQGLAVYVGPDNGYRAPDGFETLPYVYHGDLTEAQKAARAKARQDIEEAEAAVRGQSLDEETALDAVTSLLAAKAELVEAGLTGASLGAVLLSPHRELGVEATYFVLPAPEAEEDESGDESADDETVDSAAAADGRIVELAVPKAVVVVEGTSHTLHETRTDIATRGLIRDLADHPSAALTALLAQLFKLLALNAHVYQGESALTLSATRYKRASLPAHPALDGEVRARLALRREDYLASGLRPVAYVDALAHGEKMALLAELVAISLDVREVRTSLVRHGARAEAAEIAALCDADLSVHWTPDTAFLAVHSKGQLLAMLGEMGVEDARASGLKKDELVAFVAEAAAQRQWTPKALAWSASVEAEPEPAADPDAGDQANAAGDDAKGATASEGGAEGEAAAAA
ncbi:ParB N-terminal domain-containing protein [Caulobacter sp. FWC2]|jgi:ParB family chromosome partitioning protein|uniref:ParB/RepB/Spo0J family partition protein n=1 Tax=Caulobacter sp. FWC2 TaxID=69664 RepID=UPI000C15D3EE|nr:ParB N-terminal domain-containing protein [Caulobacter sp. FWC2]PIB89955.1 chromosome partitioning protein ParB [Caulobacter sp. FWC2]